MTVAGADKVGGPNRQAKRIAFAALRIRHVTPLRRVGNENDWIDPKLQEGGGGSVLTPVLL
ncbi:MAG: hypothetical protein WAL26_05495, partial [Mycobacterium sp.]